MAKANATSPANDPYVVTPGVDVAGTHLVDEVQLPPAAVVRRFGPGEAGDGYKVSRRWVFRKGHLVFTLYDWKSTSLYDAELWAPAELWTSRSPWELHVGSKAPATRADVAEFVAFLYRATSEVPPPRAPRPLRPGWCRCETVEMRDSIWADDFTCRCGVDKHHAHCAVCRGIRQVG